LAAALPSDRTIGELPAGQLWSLGMPQEMYDLVVEPASGVPLIRTWVQHAVGSVCSK
jgi:hypothetical protein